MAIKIGEKIEPFESQAFYNGEFKKVRLDDYRGKWVVLFFYPLDFTFVCPTEIRSFAQHEDSFKELNAVVLGASTDSEFSHKARMLRRPRRALPSGGCPARTLTIVPCESRPDD